MRSSVHELKAAIFDMDGLLVDSEPLWKRAEQTVFAELGLELTDAMCESTRGYRVDEVVAHWYRFKPWPRADLARTRAELLTRVGRMIEVEARPLPGARRVLRDARDRGLGVGLASSSPPALIDAVLAALGIHDCFDAVVSAEHERHGKPHPAVYFKAAAALGVAPATCVAFEDSVAGLRSAAAAGMRTVAVPDAAARHDAGFDIADLKLRSLDEFRFDMLAVPPAATRRA